METLPPSDDLHQNAEGVREFFEQWALYRKVVDHNYLHHQQAYPAIEQALKKIPEPFSFLDLGSGDASFTGAMLARLPVSRYEAVDISETALNLARKNVEALPCAAKFTRDDFFDFVQGLSESFDVVFIGLSFHHLPEADKLSFLSQIRRIVRPGGSFLFYEPVMEPGEGRDEVMGRFENYTNQWSALNETELHAIRTHVFENDYPETIGNYTEMAAEAGFASTEVLYVDAERLYAVFQCR